ncbi:MAG TPA: ABC transporter ATP-binding protein [Anaerolineales bacterium]|nr:ABC transporter ATP-binding protein [Anaerolineales bacterium]
MIQSNVSNTQPDVLVAEGLRKSYGPRQALQGLSFSLKAGRVLGFLGPNGAGKTTSIRILTTIMEPESGSFTVDGISSKYPEEIRRRIGVLPENLGFPRQMTGLEYLIYFGQLYGRMAGEAKDYGMKLLEDVGLQQRGRSLIGSYSHGMRQRIGIARALINEPVVVFLDEPTLGLDPRGQQELLELIQRIARERGTGVVLCSHLLSEIEGVCDDVVILNLGQIVAKGSVTEVIGRVQHNIVLRNALRVQVPSSSMEETMQVLKAIPNITKVSPLGEMEGWLRIELMGPTNGDISQAHQLNNGILSSLIRAKIPILGFEVEGGRLKDVFLQLTEEAIK